MEILLFKLNINNAKLFPFPHYYDQLLLLFVVTITGSALGPGDVDCHQSQRALCKHLIRWCMWSICPQSSASKRQSNQMEGRDHRNGKGIIQRSQLHIRMEIKLRRASSPMHWDSFSTKHAQIFQADLVATLSFCDADH